MVVVVSLKGHRHRHHGETDVVYSTMKEGTVERGRGRGRALYIDFESMKTLNDSRQAALHGTKGGTSSLTNKKQRQQQCECVCVPAVRI